MRKRDIDLRDTVGAAGLVSLVVGISLLSVPWALIVGGSILLVAALWPHLWR